MTPRMKDMDESVSARLNITDGALVEIKVPVTSVESSLPAHTSRVMDLEKCMEEVQGRVSATEDSDSAPWHLHNRHGESSEATAAENWRFRKPWPT